MTLTMNGLLFYHNANDLQKASGFFHPKLAKASLIYILYEDDDWMAGRVYNYITASMPQKSIFGNGNLMRLEQFMRSDRQFKL